MIKCLKTSLFILISFLLVFFIFGKWNVSKPTINEQIAQFLPQTQHKSLNEIIPTGTKINLLVDKSDYKLHIYTADTLVKTYPIVLGGNPIDDKLRRGDQCTPEGTFKMRSKYPHKSWSKFIWIDYPTADSWKKHKKAKAAGNIPKNARIGGEIGIHGVPKGSDILIKTGVNWTLGCISLSNKDIDEIYPFIDKNTKINIQK